MAKQEKRLYQFPAKYLMFFVTIVCKSNLLGINLHGNSALGY